MKSYCIVTLHMQMLAASKKHVDTFLKGFYFIMGQHKTDFHKSVTTIYKHITTILQGRNVAQLLTPLFFNLARCEKFKKLRELQV